MVHARKRARQRRRARSLIGSIREFLTPEVFKQVRNVSRRRKSPRWDLHPLLHILLLTTYCCGDSLPEKFEAARAFYVVCCPCAAFNLGKEDGCRIHLETFRWNPAGYQARLEESGQQPEASLAWCTGNLHCEA